MGELLLKTIIFEAQLGVQLRVVLLLQQSELVPQLLQLFAVYYCCSGLLHLV